METALRPYGLGAAQWYVLYHLTNEGPTMQRDLVQLLHIERATMSAILSALVRKGLIEQFSDNVDQRQKRLCMTAAGAKLWRKLPDLSFIHKTAFGGMDEQDIAIAVRVLKTATERLDQLSQKEHGA
jgi:DNA-binding MarR family transcriptional regulator